MHTLYLLPSITIPMSFSHTCTLDGDDGSNEGDTDEAYKWIVDAMSQQDKTKMK